jgi:hypothetical protein
MPLKDFNDLLKSVFTEEEYKEIERQAKELALSCCMPMPNYPEESIDK